MLAAAEGLSLNKPSWEECYCSSNRVIISSWKLAGTNPAKYAQGNTSHSLPLHFETQMDVVIVRPKALNRSFLSQNLHLIKSSPEETPFEPLWGSSNALVSILCMLLCILY